MLEYKALPRALGRLFPGSSFEIADTVLQDDLFGFTSNRVVPRSAQPDLDPADDTAIEKLVRKLGGVLSENAPDLALLVDDLELPNVDHTSDVVQATREAVQRHLAKVPARLTAKLTALFQQRASLHLLAPMVEAYLFTDRAALTRTGIPTGSLAYLLPSTDCEAFEVDGTADPAYLGSVGECERHHRAKERKCPWRGDLAERVRHPKKYLSYLCRESKAPNQYCSNYKESQGGAAALLALDWAKVFSTPTSAPFARALVEDISDALGVLPVFPPGATTGFAQKPASSAPTSLAGASALSRVLRNL